MDVDRYVRASGLWRHHPDGHDEEIVPEGALTMDELVAQRDAELGSLHYLRFVGPLGLRDSANALGDARRLTQRDDNRFHAGLGRLARGGLLPRIADGLFSLSLVVRGNVPGATAAAAALKYHALEEGAERSVYYGRVARQGGWTVCQYWFFYAYNNWRSGFHGVNDHESDWEMVAVYLHEDGGRLLPEWAAYASHDFHGADLRRRWDDRDDLELVGDHPVVNAGAGSHACYFRAGEYQAEIPLRIPGRLQPIASAFAALWRRLGQGGDAAAARRIPFIDFARADGLAIGPGQERGWEPILISEDTPWVGRYRGLWGLYARDPIAGENAPGGPMHERDGTPRASWFDPLGFAQLDQTAPPGRELALLEEQDRTLRARAAELEGLIAAETERLQRLGSELGSLTGGTHLKAVYARQQLRVAEQALVVRGLMRERVEDRAELEGVARRIERARAGRAAGPRDHIRRPMEPVPPDEMRFRRTTELWAAISVSCLLLALATLMLVAPGSVWPAVIILVLGFPVVESLLRGTYIRVINRIAVILALLAAVVLLGEFWKAAILAALIGFALFLIVQRVREFRA
jgi:hypothetical protein